MGKTLISILFIGLMLKPVVSSSMVLQESNELGPISLSAQSKQYSFKLNSQSNQNKKYYVELISDDGKNIEIPDCKKFKHFLHFACLLKNWVTSAYWSFKRVEWVEIKINNKKVVNKKEFDWSTGSLVKEISLLEKNKIVVKVKGYKKTKVNFRIYSTTESSNQPPTLELSHRFYDPDRLELRMLASDSDGQIVTGNIDFGDGSTIAYTNEYYEKTYTQSGTYLIKATVTDNDGISKTSELAVVVNLNNQYPGPIIEADFFRGNAPLTVNFNGSKSLDPDGSVSSPRWRIYSSDESNYEDVDGYSVSRTYSEAGVYRVHLEVIDNEFLVKSENVYIVVDEPLAPIPKINLVRKDLKEIKLDGSQSTARSGRQIVSYRWTLGDGSISKQAIKNWTYNNFGTYIINLTVTDNLGVSATTSKTVILDPNDVIPPFIDFDWVVQNDQVPYETVLFKISQYSSSQIISVQLDYGDGVIENYANDYSFSVHYYQLPGIYTVKMSVTDVNGLTGETVKIIDLQNVILPNIVVNGGPFSGEAPLTVNLDASQTTSVNGEIIQFEWDITNDGVYNPVSYDPNISQVITQAGQYRVSVAALDSKNRKAFKFIDINVSGLPVASIGWVVQTEQLPYQVYFYSQSESGGVPITKYEWDYGDGITEVFDGSTSYSVHYFQNQGIYNVKLKVTNAAGLTSETTTQVNLQNVQLPQIVLNGGPFTGIAPLDVTLDASQSVSQGGSILYYEWDLNNDGIYNPSTFNSTASRIYDNPGTYQGSVAITDSNNRKSFQYFTITVLESDLDYGLNIIASQLDSVNRQVELKSQIFPRYNASPWPVSGVTYQWDLGDGNISNLKDVVHNFSSNGPYLVKLTVNVPNWGSIKTSITLNNLSTIQNFPAPKFLLIGNNGPAPLTVQMDATSYALNNPNVGKFIWNSTKYKEIPTGPSSFFTFEVEGTYEVSLTVVNENGFSKSTLPQLVTVNGIKQPIYPVVHSRVGIEYGPRTNKPHIISKLPSLIELSSEESFSQNGEKLSTEWNIAGNILKGNKVHYLVSDIADYSIQATIRDESGNNVNKIISVSVPFHACENADGENICPRFLSHKDNILPMSQNQWTLSTGIQTNLLNVSEQINLLDRWIYIYDQSNKLYYDISSFATLNGADIIINQSDIRSLGLDLNAELELSISLYDESKELFQGTVFPIKLGIGSAILNAPSNATVDILSIENNYYKQIETSNAQSINLTNLPSGKYSVFTNVNNQTQSTPFTVNSEDQVSVELNSLLSISKSILQRSSIQKSATYLSPKEASMFMQKNMESYFKEYSTPDNVIENFIPKRTNARISTLAIDPSLYPTWTRQYCTGETPTHIPLSTMKQVDEFKVEGIKSWIVGAIDLGNQRISGDLLEYRKIEQDSLKLKSGKRMARFMCFVNGNIHEQANYFKFVEAKQCCTDQKCKNDLQGAFNYWGKLASSNDTLPVKFQFYVKDPETGESNLAKEHSESFTSAAESMGLSNPSSIINYFGIIDPTLTVVGLWSPSFWVDVPIPEGVIDPEIKVELHGHAQEFSDTFSAHGYGCFMPQYDGYRPEVIQFDKYETFSTMPDNFMLTDVQKDNSKRLFSKDGKFPLNWDPNPFTGIEFNSEFPIEFEASNGFGVSANRIKLKFNLNGDSYNKTLTSTDFELVEQKNINGDNIDVYRVRLNVEDYKNKFIWNRGKTLSEGLVSFKLEWDTEQSGVTSSEEALFSRPMTYNLSKASDKLCSKGFYGNYNPFATADFFRKYDKIDNEIISGRCNDIGHPFGDIFPPHKGKGHKQGVGIDLRYPSSEKSGTLLDNYDEMQRKKQIDSMADWAIQLVNRYSNSQLHIDLQNLCDSNSALISCGALIKENTNLYREDTIRIFCHLSSTRNNILSTDFNTYCGSFPKEEAIELAKSLEDIRSTIEIIVNIFPDAKIFTGIGWFNDMLKKGQYSNEFDLVRFNRTTGEFTETIFNDWNIVNVSPAKDHTSHIHISLF